MHRLARVRQPQREQEHFVFTPARRPTGRRSRPRPPRPGMRLRHEHLLQRTGRPPRGSPAGAAHVVAHRRVRQPPTSCSSTSRANTRRAVCRCLRGASRSARSIASINGLTGSSTGATRGVFRGGGTGDPNACRTVRRCTPCCSANARIDKLLPPGVPPDRREQLHRLSPTPAPSRWRQLDHPARRARWGQLRRHTTPGVSRLGPNFSVTPGPNNADTASNPHPVRCHLHPTMNDSHLVDQFLGTGQVGGLLRAPGRQLPLLRLTLLRLS